MKFVVFGAGAVGGVIGARLFQHGHEVALIARGAHAQAIAGSGLRVESPDGMVTLPLPVYTDPAEAKVGADDVVLLAVKSQDTSAALGALAGVTTEDTPVVCVQNGVENEHAAMRWFVNVYGMCVMCPTTHLVPGVVAAFSSPTTGILDVGRYPSGVDDTAHQVAAALRSSTFSSEAIPDIARWKYAKLIMNLGNAVEAVCGQHARAGEVGVRVKDEAVACLGAAGIDFASEEEDAARRGNLLTVHPINGQRREGGSSWQSLARGAGTIETDYLNGEIVRLGRMTGVPTPVNEALQHLARAAAASRLPPGFTSEADVLTWSARRTPGR